MGTDKAEPVVRFGTIKGQIAFRALWNFWENL